MTPATDMTRDFAEKHLFLSTKFIALGLPSVLVPEEFNLVINPTHKAFPKIFETAKLLGQYAVPTR